MYTITKTVSNVPTAPNSVFSVPVRFAVASAIVGNATNAITITKTTIPITKPTVPFPFLELMNPLADFLFSMIRIIFISIFKKEETKFVSNDIRIVFYNIIKDYLS